MKLTKKGLIFTVLIAASMVLGSMIAVMCKDSALQFLSYAKVIGIANESPMVIDLIVIQLTFGLTVNISVAHILTFFIAILLYPKISSNVE